MEGTAMILWVDDDINISLDSFRDEIREAGHQVIEAKTPEEMWEKLRHHSNDISIIIMDIMMPTGQCVDKQESRMGAVTGLLLAKQIKNDDIFKDIPILIFTIVSDQDVQDWAEEKNVKLLRKQNTYPDELLEVINTVISQGNVNV